MIPRWLSSWGVGLCLLLTAPSLLAEKPVPDPFVGWPASWATTYQRFENYIQATSQYFPRAELEILPNGQPVHSVKLFTNFIEGPGLVFYKNGNVILTRSASEASLNENSGHFSPATYAVVLQSGGSAGYQYLNPIVWFKTQYPHTPKHSGDTQKLVFTMIDALKDFQDGFPNERLLNFLNFHIFPKRSRNDLLKKNSKVEPSITLGVTVSGTIVREKLAPAFEKLLQWRVYHDGQLVEQGSASGMDRLTVGHGMGDYWAFVGIVGPNGFMPVSNLLHFPLFPKKPTGFEVFPNTNPITHLPLFFEYCLSAEDRQEILETAQEHHSQGGYYNDAAIYCLSQAFRTGDPAKDRLLDLWRPWSLGLNRLKLDPDEDMEHHINIAPEPVP